MSNNNTRVVPVILISALVVLLCGVMLVGGFLLGRQTLSSDEPTAAPAVAVEEAENQEAETADTPTDAPPIDEPAGDTTGDATESEPPTDEPAPPTDAPTSTPAATLSRQLGDEFTEADLEILWEVWELIEEQFDGNIPDDQDVTYAAIHGVLDTLDDEFTRFAPPDVAARSREDLEGSFEGIGAFVRENEEGLTEIVRPIDGQPADLAGLRAGDVVVAVDGESVIGQSLDEVISLIRGPRGTDVTISFEREGLDEPFTVTITRASIEIPIVESEMLEENIAYVRLTSFNRNAEEQLLLALAELLSQDPQGLIFDLRDNPGGFLDQSVAVSDIFLPEGIVLQERSTTLGIDQVYRSDNGDIAESIPLVVLVNTGSASASEIVAGAIRDTGRAVLLGETTFGKGSVQNSHTLSDGSELRVTIARWYTPDNHSIDGAGIEPDIVVETPEDLGGEEDTQLQRAIEYLLTGQ